MAEILPNLLGIGQEEWTAFKEGRLLSPNLLLKLLAYKYRKQKQIRVNSELVRELKVPPLLSPDSYVEYELNVIVYVVKDFTSIGLLVRKRVYPFPLFVGAAYLVGGPVDQLVYEVNQTKESEHMNAYFVFDFLNVYFGAQRQHLQTKETSVLATIMINELYRPRYFKESLISLYREINRLLATDARSDNNETAGKVETKKQLFYTLVLQTLEMVGPEIALTTNINKTVSPTRFLDLPPSSQSSDPIKSDATRSDSLFKELLPLVEFVWLVVATAPSIATPTLTIRNVGYTTSQVKQHLFQLTLRILSHVDTLNAASLVITQVMAHQLGFTQRDYDRLANRDASFITYNVMSHVFRETLLVGGPRALTHLRTQRKRMLWVIENEEEESNLMLLYRPEETRPYQQSLYVHNRLIGTKDVERMLKEANIRPFRQQIEVADTLTEQTDAGHYSTWYIALLIQRLSSNEGSPSIREILLSVDRRQLIKVQQSIVRRVHKNMLALVFTTPRGVLPSGANAGITESRLSHLLELQDCGKFVNDAVIKDILTTMHIRSHCYVFDPIFWAGTLFETLGKKSMHQFNNPMIDVVLMPINETQTHWSLGIIDLRLGVVSFYTSLKGRSYFPSFKNKLIPLLAKQTPNIEYQFVELTGQECQPSTSLDCSIYVLNKISQLCVSPNERVFYTRQNVTNYIREALLNQARDEKWQNFSVDLLDFFNKGPSKTEAKKYNAQLVLLLSPFYTGQDIEHLFDDLFPRGKLEKVTAAEIHALFKANLGPKKNESMLVEEEEEEVVEITNVFTHKI